jgi:hypothetical protein
VHGCRSDWKARDTVDEHAAGRTPLPGTTTLSTPCSGINHKQDLMGLRSTHRSSTRCVRTNIISTARQWLSHLVGDRSLENAYYVQKDCKGTNKSSSSASQSSYVQCTSSKPRGLLSTLRLHCPSYSRRHLFWHARLLTFLGRTVQSPFESQHLPPIAWSLPKAVPSRGQAGPMTLLLTSIPRL